MNKSQHLTRCACDKPQLKRVASRIVISIQISTSCIGLLHLHEMWTPTPVKESSIKRDFTQILQAQREMCRHCIKRSPLEY